MEQRTKIPLALGIAVVIALSAAIMTAGPSAQESTGLDELTEVLPEKERNFPLITREIYAGAPIDLCTLSEGVYKWPDFYPNWPNAKAREYDSHDYSRWIPYGYGAYPADVGYTATGLKAGDELTQCMIVRAGFGAETWQGIRLVASADGPFDVSLEPDHIKLSPSFPKFTYDWAQKVMVRIRATGPVQPGTYTVSVNAVQPDDVYNRQWIMETISIDATEEERDYAVACTEFIRKALEAGEEITTKGDCSEWLAMRTRKYVPSGGLVSIGRDMFTVQIEVPEA